MRVKKGRVCRCPLSAAQRLVVIKVESNSVTAVCQAHNKETNGGCISHPLGEGNGLGELMFSVLLYISRTETTSIRDSEVCRPRRTRTCFLAPPSFSKVTHTINYFILRTYSSYISVSSSSPHYIPSPLIPITIAIASRRPPDPRLFHPAECKITHSSSRGKICEAPAHCVRLRRCQQPTYTPLSSHGRLVAGR